MKRLVYLDMCRGFTVLFIPIIHCVMLYSKIEVHDSWLGNILSFIAEWPGGQVFMFMMGTWIAKSNRPFEYHVSRALILLACGYFLNAFKYVIPAALGILPESFIADTHFSEDRLLLDLYTIGDIMHLSSIAIVSTAAIKAIPGKVFVACVLLFVVLAFSPLFWDLQSEYFVIQHLLDLIGGHPNRSFFPVFPWMVYVLAGFVLGMMMEDSTRWMITMFLIGLAVFTAGCFINDGPNVYGFYRTESGGTCQHLGFVLMWVPFWKWITPYVSLFEGLRVTLAFCSKHITSIYFVQWVVVAWLFPVIGYRTLGLWQSLAIGIIVTAIVFASTYLLSFLFCLDTKKKQKKSRLHKNV